ncbi:MAG TPA: mechanosensitive ion channel family protein, partial [Bacteroidales bacterium]|nr:mechanosensitive ion channel family protein [Bacteroidales bacterium]
MIENWIAALNSLLRDTGLSQKNANLLETIIVLLVIFLLSFLADKIAKKILISSLKNFVRKSRNKWDDILLSYKFFHRLAHIAPALVVYYTIDYAFDLPNLVGVIKTASVLYIILISLLVIDSFLSALHSIYMTFPISKEKPIKGYVQLVKIAMYLFGIIVMISILSGTPALKLLAGLGALAAVLLLVFKDTILGLVASIQVSANNMVKPGDWITMPSRNADGTVLEITLNTVKVQNWDKTIITFPTYSLVTEAFNNWKGMEESGGRRIKRSVNIDMRSVKFMDPPLKEKLRKIQLIKDYIAQREEEIDRFNQERKVDPSMPVNGRRMTNLGIFRKYIEAYLKQHPRVNTDLTFLIRHLQPSETGLPIEIYIFSRDQEWAKYEAVQADIFDHILASIPYFELRVFQNPTGDDFKAL